jgi:hypothetical protein
MSGEFKITRNSATGKRKLPNPSKPSGNPNKASGLGIRAAEFKKQNKNNQANTDPSLNKNIGGKTTKAKVL